MTTIDAIVALLRNAESAHPNGSSNLLSLSDEILLMILDYLNEKEAIYASRVCKRFRAICKDTSAWDRFYIPMCPKLERPCPSGKHLEGEKLERVYCDNCQLFQLVEDDDEEGLHTRCKGCKNVFCAYLISGCMSSGGEKYCIKCLHDRTEQGSKTKCGKPWSVCRKTISIVTKGYDGIFSCLTEICQICDNPRPDIKELKLRTERSSTIINIRVCTSCKKKLQNCSCGDEDCACSRRDVKSKDDLGWVYHWKKRIVCDHCANHHCHLMEVPQDIEIALSFWKHHAYTGMDPIKIISRFVKCASQQSSVKRKLTMFAIIRSHTPYRESLTQKDKEQIGRSIQRTLENCADKYIETLILLRESLI